MKSLPPKPVSTYYLLKCIMISCYSTNYNTVRYLYWNTKCLQHMCILYSIGLYGTVYISIKRSDCINNGTTIPNCVVMAGLFGGSHHRRQVWVPGGAGPPQVWSLWGPWYWAVEQWRKLWYGRTPNKLLCYN